jgi:hypothetical protein
VEGHGQQTPVRIVIHTTEGDSASPLIFSKGLGAQYVVGPDGTIYNYLPDNQVAWGVGGNNQGTLDIEIVGHADFSKKDWAGRSAQLRSVSALIGSLSQKYNIPIQLSTRSGVSTHAMNSKIYAASQGHWDPGPNFPLRQVLTNAGGANLGAMPSAPQPSQPGTAPQPQADFSDVPKPLMALINKVSAKYGVPPDLMAGIWRIESGRTYSAGQVGTFNSKGYGGLFGTSVHGPHTAEGEADLAASILATGLKKANGNVAEALSYYNSGQLTGGYTSVPGQVTQGTYTPGQTPPPTDTSTTQTSGPTVQEAELARQQAMAGNFQTNQDIPLFGMNMPSIDLPGQGDIFSAGIPAAQSVGETWQLLSTNGQVSPDTTYLAGLAQQYGVQH